MKATLLRAGKVVRGYVVEGLGGSQFATSATIDHIRTWTGEIGDDDFFAGLVRSAPTLPAALRVFLLPRAADARVAVHRRQRQPHAGQAIAKRGDIERFAGAQIERVRVDVRLRRQSLQHRFQVDDDDPLGQPRQRR